MTYLIVFAAVVIGAWALNGLANMIHRIGAGGPTSQKQLGAPRLGGPGNDGETGTDRGGSATNCGTRAAPHNPRVTILARSRPYDQDDQQVTGDELPGGVFQRQELAADGSAGASTPALRHRCTGQDDAA